MLSILCTCKIYGSARDQAPWIVYKKPVSSEFFTTTNSMETWVEAINILYLMGDQIWSSKENVQKAEPLKKLPI